MKLVFTIPGTTHKFKVNHSRKTINLQEKKNYRLNIAKHLPKGFIPFHACLLKHSKKSVIISGPALSGKSTLASKLFNSGFKVQANDFIVVWKKEEKLLAADLNFASANKGKKPVLIKKLICLAPNDCRDCFRYTEKEMKDHYYEILKPLSSKQLARFLSQPIFKEIIKSHIVLGNRHSPNRWCKTLNSILNTKKPEKIGVIGMGVIGEGISSLFLQENWPTQLNLFSPNKKKLLSQTLDLKSANPKINIINRPSALEAIKHSDLLIFCFRSQPQKLVKYGGERMKKLLPHLKIVWELTRKLRKVNYAGKILVVTNPVDILSWATYHFSNLNNRLKLDWKGLDSNQVMGIGLGLDYARLKTLTNLPLELIGEHGDNLIISMRKLNQLIETKQKKILEQVKNYSSQVRKFTERTKFGPAHEVLRVVNILRRNKGILRISSLNRKSVFLGNIFNYSNSILTPRYRLSSKLGVKLNQVNTIHLAYQKKVFGFLLFCHT